jgi:hypothetical protein
MKEATVNVLRLGLSHSPKGPLIKSFRRSVRIKNSSNAILQFHIKYNARDLTKIYY